MMNYLEEGGGQERSKLGYLLYFTCRVVFVLRKNQKALLLEL